MNAAMPLAPPRANWALKLFALVLGLFAAALAIGGGWLLALGGSWYYLVAGVLLLASAVQLWRGRRLGATLSWIALALTVAWAAWESGLDYWRWVPRLGLLVAFALVLALLLPRLPERPARPALARGLAGAFALVFVVAFALAFVPHGVTRGGAVPAPHALAPAAGVAGAQPKDAPAPGDWAAYGRDNAGTRFSPLAQITPDNVGKLQRAWTFRTGDIPAENWGAETTPLKVGDRLYLCTARSQVLALDAASGRELWRFDPKVADKSIPSTAACRGVAYSQLPAGRTDAEAPPNAATLARAPLQRACTRRIISGTLDARLLAVDADTGKPCADFGDNGQVDITAGDRKSVVEG